MSKNNLLPPLDYLLAFESTVESGSFSGASKALNISETAISRKVKLLEHHYKLNLFIRGHRSIQISPHGQQLFDEISPVLGQLRSISENRFKDAKAEAITLAATNSVAGLWLMPRLPLFNADNQELRIKLVSSDSDEECLAEDIHLSILRGDGKWLGYQAQLLFGETIFPVCSPEYFTKHPEIAELSNLAQHSLIGVASTHTEWMNWHTWLSHNGLHVKKLDQTVLFNTYPLSIDAAANGLGVALGWGHLLDHLVDQGKLVRPLGDISIRTDYGYYLLKPEKSSSFSERDVVESWLLELSAARRRYDPLLASQ